MKTTTVVEALDNALTDAEELRHVARVLTSRTRELEALIVHIAYTEVELETLCIETISAVRNVANAGNQNALDFLTLAHRQIAEVEA